MKNIAIIAAALAACVSAPAAAAEDTVIVVETVDLDLANSDDLARLDTRIENAIRSHCQSGGRTLWDKAAERDCHAEMSANAAKAVRVTVAKVREGQLALLKLDPGA